MWRRSFKLPQAKPRVKMAGLENSLLVGETRQNNKSKYINLNSLSVPVNAWTNSLSPLWHPTDCVCGGTTWLPFTRRWMAQWSSTKISHLILKVCKDVVTFFLFFVWAGGHRSADGEAIQPSRGQQFVWTVLPRPKLLLMLGHFGGHVYCFWPAGLHQSECVYKNRPLSPCCLKHFKTLDWAAKSSSWSL